MVGEEFPSPEDLETLTATELANLAAATPYVHSFNERARRYGALLATSEAQYEAARSIQDVEDYTAYIKTTRTIRELIRNCLL